MNAIVIAPSPPRFVCLCWSRDGDGGFFDSETLKLDSTSAGQTAGASVPSLLLTVSLLRLQWITVSNLRKQFFLPIFQVLGEGYRLAGVWVSTSFTRCFFVLFSSLIVSQCFCSDSISSSKVQRERGVESRELYAVGGEIVSPAPASNVA